MWWESNEQRLRQNTANGRMDDDVDGDGIGIGYTIPMRQVETF